MVGGKVEKRSAKKRTTKTKKPRIKQEPLLSTQDKVAPFLQDAISRLPTKDLLNVGRAFELSISDMQDSGAIKNKDDLRKEILEVALSSREVVKDIRTGIEGIGRLFVGVFGGYPRMVLRELRKGGMPAYLFHDRVMGILKTLSPREGNVICMTYGLNGYKPHTLDEIGIEYEVTRERIRQIAAKALRKLRHPSRSKRLARLPGEDIVIVYPDEKIRDIVHPEETPGFPSHLNEKLRKEGIETWGELVTTEKLDARDLREHKGEIYDILRTSEAALGLSESGLKYYKIPMDIRMEALDLVVASLPINLDTIYKLERGGIDTVLDVIEARTSGLKKLKLNPSEITRVGKALSRYNLSFRFRFDEEWRGLENDELVDSAKRFMAKRVGGLIDFKKTVALYQLLEKRNLLHRVDGDDDELVSCARSFMAKREMWGSIDLKKAVALYHLLEKRKLLHRVDGKN